MEPIRAVTPGPLQVDIATQHRESPDSPGRITEPVLNFGRAIGEHLRAALVESAVTMRGEPAERVIVAASSTAGGVRLQSQCPVLCGHGVASGHTAAIGPLDMKVKFYERYSWHMKATAEVAVSDGSERSTTDADAKLLDRDDIAPGRIREPTPSDGTSRLTHCPPKGSSHGQFTGG